VCGTCKSLYKIVIESKVVEKREVIHYEWCAFTWKKVFL
jgi:hypothetical protein